MIEEASYRQAPLEPDADCGAAPTTPFVSGRAGRWPTSWLTAAMVLGGALVALQARINGELGVRMHSAIAATTVSFVVALVLLGPLVAVRCRTALRRLVAHPGRWWYWSGGLGGILSASALAEGTPLVGVRSLSACWRCSSCWPRWRRRRRNPD